LSGKLYDDAGLLVNNGTVEVSSVDDPSLNQTLTVAGGAWALPNVPAGAKLTLKATSPGYVTRERKITLPSEFNASTSGVFRYDFGGDDEGAKYALSQFPEIASVTPSNLESGVSTNPLVITLKFSHPLETKEQDKFAQLFAVHFQVPGGEKLIQHHTAYNDEEARLTWNEAGDVATFKFNAPLVTRSSGDSALTIALDDSVSLDQWPRARNERLLAQDRVYETVDAGGSTVRQRMAPFLRDLAPVVLPSVRPSALPLWGFTHRVSSVFSLANDTTPPKVLSVLAYRGINGANDRIAVTFSEPVRGFPEEMLDGSPLKPSNYRFVLGKFTSTTETDRFNKANPAVDGGSPSLPLTYSTTKYDVVYINLPSGTFGDYTDFKLYVAPDVKDLAGNGLQTSSPDPTTGLSDNILKGRIL
jgi:hypothetical protein